jgi:peptidyl-prolyl cis-trans isomerase A (cyclophilin A)
MGEVDLPKGFGRVKVFAVTGPNEDPPALPAPGADSPAEVGARPRPFAPDHTVGTSRTSDPEALKVFLLICGLPRVKPEDWEEARKEAARLHAHLGGGSRGAYIATTAYAWFCQRTNHNRGTRAQYQKAQEDVERHLNDPAAPWDVPVVGIIHEFATSAAENNGNPIWMRLPEPILVPPSGSTTTSGARVASPLHPDLLDPSAASAKAPDVFKVKFATTKGDFVVEVHRAWAPHGADRFYNLVKTGFFDDTRFFRVIAGFMVQFGISGVPMVSAAWHDATIADDPVKQSNKRSFVSFAMRGPGSRTTQIFINYGDNVQLDGKGFSPFARVTDGMDVVDRLHNVYGETPTTIQPTIESQGNAYLDASFPQLDAIKRAEIVK